MPVDISAAYIKNDRRRIEADHPDLLVNPIVARFSLALPAATFGVGTERRVRILSGFHDRQFHAGGGETSSCATRASLLRAAGF